ncbi:erythromycin esterase family protein [Saccharopolyspora sp. NPDC000995]
MRRSPRRSRRPRNPPGLTAGNGSGQPRGEFMTDAVHRLLDRGHRVVISSHNGHVQRSPITGRPTMGGLLAPELGSDMVVIATPTATACKSTSPRAAGNPTTGTCPCSGEPHHRPPSKRC